MGRKHSVKRISCSFPKRQILDSSKQMTISNLEVMAQTSPKGYENSEGKGEIARNEQFLLFPQCFQKAYAVTDDHSFKHGCFSI